MSFEDTTEELESEEVGVGHPVDLNDDIAGAGDSEEVIEEIVQEEQEKPSQHYLEVRRAIEDHWERTRLRKELDYLYDDDFAINSDKKH